MESNTRAGRQQNPGNTRTSALPQGKNYLFVIGIDRYQNQGIRTLANPVLDAQEFVKVLTEKYQFSDDPEFLITLYDEAATETNIYKQLDDLCEKVTKDDSLIIYFSGHGEYRDRIDVGFWIPYNGDPANPMGSYISFQNLMAYIEAIPSFHTFIIADSCYAGTLFKARGAGDVRSRLESIPSRWLLTAGRTETVPDGVPGQHSPFANAVLTWLNANTAERYSVADFCRNVMHAIDSGRAEQTPQGESLRIKGNLGGEFMFRLKEFANVKIEEALPVTVEEQENRGIKQPPVDDVAAPTPTSPKPRPTTPAQPVHSISDLKKQLNKHLANDEFEESFELFDRAIPDDGRASNTLISLQGQYNSIKRQQLQGTVDNNFATITRNRIRMALTDTVERLKEEDLEKDFLQPIAMDKKVDTSFNDKINKLQEQGLQTELELKVEKFNYFKEEMTLSSNPDERFNLNKRLKQLQVEIDEIKGKLGI